MSDSCGSPVENSSDLFSQPTSCSDATSSTAFSKVSLSPLRKAARSFGLFQSKSVVDDVEKQVVAKEDEEEEEEEDDDDGSIFKACGPNGTKVRTRKFIYPNFGEPV